MPRSTHTAEYIGVTLLHAVLLVGSLLLLRNGTYDQPVQILIALVPALSTLLLVWAILRYLNRLDEYLRKVQLDSIAIAAAGTALLSLNYGLLEVLGFPKLSMFLVWGVMGLLWAGSSVLLNVLHSRGARPEA